MLKTKKNNLKISILVPVYGVERYIERCATSLFSQTYENIEFVFVNDCTKDDSITILNNVLAKYPNRKSQVKILEHKQNMGLASARLTGINAATGDYIWFVDSDDYVDICAVEKVLPWLCQNYDLILFDYFLINSQGKYIKMITDVKLNTNNLIERIGPSVWKFFIKRELIIRNCIFPVTGLNYSEDHVLIARLGLVAKKMCYLKNFFLYYYDYTNPNAYSHNVDRKSLEDYARDGIIVYNYFKDNNSTYQYRRALALMLITRYELIYRHNPTDPVLQILKRNALECDRTFVTISLKLLKQRSLLLFFQKLYRNLL